MTITAKDFPEIKKIIDGLDPVDWVQMRLTANLTPADRVLAGVRAQSFVKSALRGTLSLRFPEMTLSELNMKVLSYLTPVRIRGDI